MEPISIPVRDTVWIAVWNKNDRAIVLGAFDSLEKFGEQFSGTPEWAQSEFNERVYEWDLGNDNGKYILSPITKNRINVGIVMGNEERLRNMISNLHQQLEQFSANKQ